MVRTISEILSLIQSVFFFWFFSVSVSSSLFYNLACKLSTEQGTSLVWIAARVTPWIIILMMMEASRRESIIALLDKPSICTRMVPATKEFWLFPCSVFKKCFVVTSDQKSVYHPHQPPITIFFINWNFTINTLCNCWEINQVKILSTSSSFLFSCASSQHWGEIKLSFTSQSLLFSISLFYLTSEHKRITKLWKENGNQYINMVSDNLTHLMMKMIPCSYSLQKPRELN